MKTFSLANARDLLVNKEISALELIEATLERCTRFAHLNALITPTPEQALAAAKVSDARRAKGKAGLMEGLPIAIKDMFCTEGIRTTAGSKMLENFVPTYESTVTTKLKIAGSISVGKANQDEFAMGSSTENSSFYPTVNPFDHTRVPGGSSGGAAASVAANDCTRVGSSCRFSRTSWLTSSCRT